MSLCETVQFMYGINLWRSSPVKPWIGKLRPNIAKPIDGQICGLRKAPWGDEYEIGRLIELQIQTCFYRIGEINHIRALLLGNDDWDH